MNDDKLKLHFDAVLSNLQRLDTIVFIHKQLLVIIEQNDIINIKNTFYTFLNECYSTTIFMGIRRHVKRYKSRKDQKQSYSLLALLYDLKIYYKGKSDAKYLLQVEKDISLVESYFQKYGGIIDKVISHLDKDIIDKSFPYNFSEIEECVERLLNCILRYFPFFYPNHGYLGSKIEEGDTWRNIFKTAWIIDK